MGPSPAPRGAVWTYLGFAASLAVFFLLVEWMVSRRERALEVEHRAAVARAAAEPGTPVTDPVLPAGVVLVDLVPVAPELPLEAPATIRAAGQRAEWSSGAPARFAALPPGRRIPLVIAGPYAVEGASIAAPAGDRGTRVAVRAIPVLPPRVHRADDSRLPQVPEKYIELDLRVPGQVTLVWKQGVVVIAESRVPRSPASAVAAKIRDEWRQLGSHSDVADRRLDQAILRVAPTDVFDDIRFLVEALLSTRREMNLGGEKRTVPAFDVVVQRPVQM